MDETPRPIADLDDDDTADSSVVTGPLGKLVEQQLGPGSVESNNTPESTTSSQPSIRPPEYAEGTTEHEDDHEG
jgi:hypothetical protein